MRNTITHPKLGIIRAMSPAANVWATQPLPLGAFGYVAPIEVWTAGGVPGTEQVDAMLSIYQATPEFREQVAGYMLEQYIRWERPAYLKQVGDPRFRQVLHESDLPEIRNPSEIWRLITGLCSVIVDEEANLSLAFRTTFDKSHEFAVRFRDGELYEVMMDG